jgi:acetate CoA/acetoacetate CoA-transferase alpha subunit
MGKIKENKLVSKNFIMSCLQNNQSIMVSGFSTCGIPTTLLEFVYESGIDGITLISCSAGKTGSLVNYVQTKLIHEKKVKKSIHTFVSTNREAGKLWQAGELDMELVPQGTFVERIRAGGCGLGGVLTPVGLGTLVERGKDIIHVDGRPYLLEKPLRADVAILHAFKAEKFGNLMLKYCGRNFAPYMAMAAEVVIVQAEEIVENGTLRDSEKMIPGIFVDYIYEEPVIYRD